MTPRDVLIVSGIGAFFAVLICLVLAASVYATYRGVQRVVDWHEDRRAPRQETTADRCCERWWTSFGTDHDPTCPNQKRSRTT